MNYTFEYVYLKRFRYLNIGIYRYKLGIYKYKAIFKYGLDI